MKHDTRDTSIPLYYWIKTYGGINNVPSNARMQHKIPGYTFADEVLIKLVKIYKVKAGDFRNLQLRAMSKFRTHWYVMPHYHTLLRNKKDEVVQAAAHAFTKGHMIVIKNKSGREELRVGR